MQLEQILNDCGFGSAKVAPVHGGDINSAFCVHAENAKYFLKVNDASKYPEMFSKEAAGLNALRVASSFIVPAVIKCGIVGDQQYLLLEWIETGKANASFWENFGAALASLHQHTQQLFGWVDDNYIGSIIQSNDQHIQWHSFYANGRIMPLVKRLFDHAALSKQDLASADMFCKNLEQLMPNERPALVHGDLWSGNFMISENATAAIFDPAIYYGHREMDIGMTKLFGGFDHSFYDAYNNTFPLEKDWEKRLAVSQLYPVLVHAVLFGGHYINQARETIHRFS
jgi:protein-ribulosamine 3-kinase